MGCMALRLFLENRLFFLGKKKLVFVPICQSIEKCLGKPVREDVRVR